MSPASAAASTTAARCSSTAAASSRSVVASSKRHARSASRTGRGSLQPSVIGQHGLVQRPGLGARVEQRQVRRAGDPGAPQVVVGRVGPSLEQVEQAAPVGRSVPALGRSVRRLVGQRAVGRVGPDRAQAVVTGSLGDGRGKGGSGGVGVVLLQRLLGPDRAPAVERDAGRLELVGQLRRLDLELQVGRHLVGVVRRERLVRPAIGQQGAVEPAVGGLVEDHEVVGVVGDLDVAGRRVEQARHSRRWSVPRPPG